MTPETLFTICNTAVLPAWLLLALAPGWKWTHHLVHSAWIPMLLGIVNFGVYATNAESPGVTVNGPAPAVIPKSAASTPSSVVVVTARSAVPVFDTTNVCDTVSVSLASP